MCWAASGVSCIGYVKSSAPAQSNFVKTVKGSVVNSGAIINEIKYGLSCYGVSSTYYGRSMSFDAVRNSIYYGDSSIIAALRLNMGGGHAVVIDGYSEGTIDYIDYMDPYTGNFHMKRYSEFKGGSSYSQTWTDSLSKIY